MMKKYPYELACASRARKVAVSLFIGSAIGVLTGPASAQPGAEQPRAPTLAITKQAALPTENLDTPKVQVFRSDPALSRPPVAADVLPGTSAPAPLPPADSEPATAVAPPLAADQPYVLAADMRPWPLAYIAPTPLNALYFSLPTEREARVMLPGHARDVAERAQHTVSRYITDNLGSAGQARARQLEALTLWLANHNRQRAALPPDPWAAYQFSQEAHAAMAEFKKKIMEQTAPEVARMVADVTAGVTQIAPVMDATASYELQLHWYKVLVQLKEGVGLYQTRVAESDGQLLNAIADFENNNPRALRPEGEPPRRVGGRVAPTNELTHPAAEASIGQPREQAKPLPQQEAPSQTGGIIILFGFAAVVFGLFMKLRKRVAGKGSAKKANAE